MRLPLGKSFQCSSSMDVSSQTAGFFRAVSQNGARLSAGFFAFEFFLLLLICLSRGNRFAFISVTPECTAGLCREAGILPAV